MSDLSAEELGALPLGRLLLYDAFNMRFRELKLRRDPACPVCGDHPTIKELIDYEQFCGLTPAVTTTAAPGLPTELETTVEELKARIDRGERLFILDVREPNEFQIARIPGSTLIPLGELPKRFAEVPSGPGAPEIIVNTKTNKRPHSTMIPNARAKDSRGRIGKSFRSPFQTHRITPAQASRPSRKNEMTSSRCRARSVNPFSLTERTARGRSANVTDGIPAVTSRGHMRFMIKEKGGVNAGVFIEFLRRLMVGSKNKIFLIVDRGPAHVAKKTKAFVTGLGGKLRLFYLPPYSPDRNPDELVWKHLKVDTVGRTSITNLDDFRNKVKSSMLSLQRNPEKIRSFFHKPSLKYAA